MEIEYKWGLQAAEGSRKALDAAELIAPYVRGVQGISMHAVYYDTADGLTGQLGVGLRIRRENERSVCCLKVPVNEGGCAVRHEYEVEAADIHEGLAALQQADAPVDLCGLLAVADLIAACETQFERRAFALEVPAGAVELPAGAGGTAPAPSEPFAAELAFDEGVLRREGREQPLREMELEHKGGSLAAFHAFAAQLEATLGLAREPLSKHARAMRL